MAARTGMATIISDLRQKTNAGTADYTLGATTFWQDSQLQAELDKTQQTWRSVPLNKVPTLVNGTYEYYDYFVPAEMTGELEENAVDSGWAVKDSTGGTVSAANYAVNYQAKRITFSANTQGSALYLDARTYNTNKAAANVWRMKASAVSANVDWQSDNHRVSASQESANCLRMASYFDELAGSSTGRFVRVDEV